MARVSVVERNKKRKQLSQRHYQKRQALKKIVKDTSLPLQERMKAQFKLTQLPRDGSHIRVRNRCELTGRPRGYYRDFKLSRIALRELSANGLIPGVVKASW